MRKKHNIFSVFLLGLFSMVFSSCGVTPTQNIQVTDFSFALTSSSIEKGNSCFITDVKILPENASNKNIQYWVEDNTIASISNGQVTGLNVGNSKVCGKTMDGSNISFKVDISVVNRGVVLVEQLQLVFDKTTFDIGESFTPVVNVLPSDAANKSFDIVASNDDVSINKTTNEITCIKNGTTTLKAVAKDDGKAVSNTVDITINKVMATAISATAEKTKLPVNSKTQISVSYTPVNTTDKAVTYKTKSGNNSVISVSSTGEVTGMGEGKDSVVITLVANTSIKTEISFEITKLEPSSVTISLPTTVYKGDVYQATANVLPAKAYDTTPIFSISSGADKANITENGLLTVLKDGSFTVHVYLKEKPSVTADLTINSLNQSNPNDPHKDDIFEGA